MIAEAVTLGSAVAFSVGVVAFEVGLWYLAKWIWALGLWKNRRNIARREAIERALRPSEEA